MTDEQNEFMKSIIFHWCVCTLVCKANRQNLCIDVTIGRRLLGIFVNTRHLTFQIEFGWRCNDCIGWVLGRIVHKKIWSHEFYLPMLVAVRQGGFIRNYCIVEIWSAMFHWQLQLNAKGVCSGSRCDCQHASRCCSSSFLFRPSKSNALFFFREDIAFRNLDGALN